MKKHTLIVITFILIILSIVKVYEQKKEQKEGHIINSEVAASNQDTEGNTEDNSDVGNETSPVIIRAYICGKVKEQGVYGLKEGSRVVDFVEVAGGLLEGAAAEYVNLAAVVNDGDRIYIPSLEEVAGDDDKNSLFNLEQNGTGTDVSQGGKVNINTADLQKLMTLPGVGETKARAILSYRKDHGKFADIKDILNVSGIGNSTFSNIKDYITVK